MMFGVTTFATVLVLMGSALSALPDLNQRMPRRTLDWTAATHDRSTLPQMLAPRGQAHRTVLADQKDLHFPLLDRTATYGNSSGFNFPAAWTPLESPFFHGGLVGQTLACVDADTTGCFVIYLNITTYETGFARLVGDAFNNALVPQELPGTNDASNLRCINGGGSMSNAVIAAGGKPPLENIFLWDQATSAFVAGAPVQDEVIAIGVSTAGDAVVAVTGFEGSPAFGVLFSGDGGKSWASNMTVANPLGTLSTRPVMVASLSNSVAVVLFWNESSFPVRRGVLVRCDSSTSESPIVMANGTWITAVRCVNATLCLAVDVVFVDDVVTRTRVIRSLDEGRTWHWRFEMHINPAEGIELVALMGISINPVDPNQVLFIGSALTPLHAYLLGLTSSDAGYTFAETPQQPFAVGTAQTVDWTRDGKVGFAAATDLAIVSHIDASSYFRYDPNGPPPTVPPSCMGNVTLISYLGEECSGFSETSVFDPKYCYTLTNGESAFMQCFPLRNVAIQWQATDAHCSENIERLVLQINQCVVESGISYEVTCDCPTP